ncbi:MAG: hypothetical protein IRZ03_17345 [Acidobacterium ailaaui]|nr:hypothetical protein [Pseudacidobacterium ailaaui]
MEKTISSKDLTDFLSPCCDFRCYVYFGNDVYCWQCHAFTGYFVEEEEPLKKEAEDSE